MNKVIVYFITLFFLVACGKNLPSLSNIDIETWQLDKDGCSGYRNKTSKTLQSEINKLKGLSEMDIVTLLGAPDQNELYKRNQKFYTYFLEPSKSCPTPSARPLRLIIRFNAMGLAKEVTTE